MPHGKPLSDDPARPLRRDAERNRRRIMDAARELFAARGLGVTLDDIADHAGVGVGTVYRRFPEKDVLIEALFDDRLGELLALAQEALQDDDAWRGLTTFLHGSLAMQAGDRGLKELILGGQRGRAHVTQARQRLAPIVAQLVARAQAQGDLRPDADVTDFPLFQIMIGAIIDCSRDVEPELWRRFLGLLLDGLRARDGASPLPAPALSFPQLEAAMGAWRPPRS